MSTLLLDQAKARIRRKGQTKHCLYYHIFTDEVDKRISDTVRSGMDVTTSMLEEWDKADREIEDSIKEANRGWERNGQVGEI